MDFGKVVKIAQAVAALLVAIERVIVVVSSAK